jgi:hypothetical protein
MNKKKIMPAGYYDGQFRRTTKKTGKWRVVIAHLYKKFKRTTKRIVKADVLTWGKIKYQPKG